MNIFAIQKMWNRNIATITPKKVKITQKPWFQGVLLMGCVIIAMLLANLPLTKTFYHSLLESNVSLNFIGSLGDIDISFPKDMTVEKFINDILMVFFFFTVGLEIKNEISHGELSSIKKAIMPVIAAFGGVLAPAAIFAIVNHGTAAASGWGIPTATDIAFAVCILAVLGKKVPVAMKVFLTALAIADDLIAILVVALFYGGKINIALLGIAICVILLTVMMKKVGVKATFPYLLSAFLIWVLFYYSGIHATMAGVVMAFAIPAEPRYSKAQLFRKFRRTMGLLSITSESNGKKGFNEEKEKEYLLDMEKAATGSLDMSFRVEHALTPYVNYIILPLFAIANAGVEITSPEYFNVFQFDPVQGGVGLGIFLGLVLGKPFGITLFSYLAVKFKLGDMPEKTSWPMFLAVACLGGIGFTMSIFVDTLSFGDCTDPAIIENLRNAGKISVLMGSIFAGLMGSILVNVVHSLQAEKKQ